MQSENREVVVPEEFWETYEQYILSDFHDKGLNEKMSGLIAKSQKLWYLKRPEKGQNRIFGWIALRDQHFFNRIDGTLMLYISPGDVLVQEVGYDRDMFLTHTPLISRMSGWFLLNGNVEETIGLWAPIFEPQILERAIAHRMDEAKASALHWFAEYSK